MLDFLKKNKNLIILITIIILSGVGAVAYANKTVKSTLVADWIDPEYFAKRNATENDLASNESEEENIIEEPIVEAVQEVEKVVEYKGKKIEVPKAIVATSPIEDNEGAKKSGGEKVNVESFEATGGEWLGIDVSYWQGTIDWKQVADSGVQFAMLRVGYRGYTTGAVFEDSTFKRNASQAIANGIKIGVYFYSAAITEDEALQEAAWVCNKIAAYSITYPVVYDFEDFGAYRCANLTGSDVTKNALAFLNYVSSKGYSPMMYANPSVMSSYLSRSSFKCKFWLAHYVKGAPQKKSSYAGSYQMWQYTASGSVPGISGLVDMNIAYFGYTNTEPPKHEHNFLEFVKIIKQPTEKEPGIAIYRCECGEVEEREVPYVPDENTTTNSITNNELANESGTENQIIENTTNPIENEVIVNTVVEPPPIENTSNEAEP
jgi:GH25 family lysozyme M1 (1,4-beta-N-acetylmuramidase)